MSLVGLVTGSVFGLAAFVPFLVSMVRTGRRNRR
jgi:hypothetical protein